MTTRERQIEKALIDWFQRQGEWKIDDSSHVAISGDYHSEIDLPELARHIADDLDRGTVHLNSASFV